MTRWGETSMSGINSAINNSVPLNTIRNKTSIWRQFQNFCSHRKYEFSENTTAQMCEILKDYAYNMRKSNGEEYKESVIKTHWNTVAKELQENYFKNYNKKFNPFSDIEFKTARDARDSKRKQLQSRPEKRKQSAVAFTTEELSTMQKCWDEETPAGLQIKFFNIAATELAWRGNEAAYALVTYFHNEIDNHGNETGRIIYNPIFTKTTQGGSKNCANDKWLTPNEADPNICPVRLYKKMIEKRPPHVTTERLFLTPNPNYKLNNSSGWYKNLPVGICELSKWTKKTAEKVGIDTKIRKITNHSHRSTAVTHLANAGISDQQLIKVTGHGNSNSIAPYLTLQPKRHADIINQMRKNKSEARSENKGAVITPINIVATNTITATNNTEVLAKNVVMSCVDLKEEYYVQ